MNEKKKEIKQNLVSFSRLLTKFIFNKIYSTIKAVYLKIKGEYRYFYVKLFTVQCEKCDYNFLYTYHNFDLQSCPNCGIEYCKYCLEEYEPENHDNKKCIYRYYLMYLMGLVSFMILYLKFMLMCNSHAVTEYSLVTVFVCEYTFFYNETESFLLSCISLKNIILGIILLIYYNEGDIIYYILVGIIQMIFIVLINTVINKCRKGIKKKNKYRLY